MENIPNVNHVVTENDLLLAPHVFPEGTEAGDIVAMSNDGLAEIGYTLVQVTETDLDLQDQGYEIGQFIELPLSKETLNVETVIVQSGADPAFDTITGTGTFENTEENTLKASNHTDLGEKPSQAEPVVEQAPEVQVEAAPAMTTFDKPTFYRGMEIMGAVEDVDHNGTAMKRFTTIDKSNFFISAADFNNNLE